MPANLPPQYFELTKKLKDAKETEEKISILEQMLAVCPKHKGTEKLQRDLKSKLAKLKKETEIKKKTKREEIYTVKKEGAGQIVIIGPPNSGKTSLVNALTSANFKVADYPFTTTLPQPAMMPYEDILIQLVDTPPLTKDFCPGWLKNILKEADGILVVFDASSQNLEKEIEAFKNLLENFGLVDKKVFYLLNKVEVLSHSNILRTTTHPPPEGPKQKFGRVVGGSESQASLGPHIGIYKISAEKKIGFEDLKKKIFEMLEIVRVYGKKPGKEPDLKKPFILKKGFRLLDLIEEIDENLTSKFKFARLFKSNIKNSIIVGKDYIFEDKDIIEIHF